MMDFKRIDLGAAEVLRAPLAATRYIDLGFASLYYTAEAFDMCYAFYGDTPVLRIDDGETYAYVLPRAENITDIARQIGGDVRFEYIKEHETPLYERAGARISLDDRYSDYLCTYDDYVEINKAVAPSKYKDYNQFLKKHSVALRELNVDNLHVAKNILEDWCRDRDCALCAYGCEKNWILRLFDGWEFLNVKGVIMSVDGAECAFNVGEVNGDTLLKLVVKSVNTPSGAMIYMGVNSARLICNVKYVNLGAHSGVPGLISFKNKFKPYTKLHKYTGYIDTTGVLW